MRECDKGRPLTRPVSRPVTKAARGLLAGTAVASLCLAAGIDMARASGAETDAGAQLAAADTVLDFAIAPQPLAAALDSFAERAGLSLAYRTGDLSNLQSPGVTGRMSSAEALERLLAGSGITFEFTDSSTVLLTRGGDGAGRR